MHRGEGGKGLLVLSLHGLVASPLFFRRRGAPIKSNVLPSGRGRHHSGKKKRRERRLLLPPPPRTTINMSLSKMRRRRKEGRGGKKRDGGETAVCSPRAELACRSQSGAEMRKVFLKTKE